METIDVEVTGPDFFMCTIPFICTKFHGILNWSLLRPQLECLLYACDYINKESYPNTGSFSIKVDVRTQLCWTNQVLCQSHARRKPHCVWMWQPQLLSALHTKGDGCEWSPKEDKTIL